MSYLFIADTDPYAVSADQSLIASSYDLRLGGLTGFPATVANWNGQDVPGDGTERLGLSAYQQVFRRYTDSLGRLVWLRLLATTDWEVFDHRPPICYVYNNYDLEPESTVSVPIGAASLRMRGFAASQGQSNHLVIYTFLWSDKYRDIAQGATMVELVAPFGDGRDDKDAAARLLDEFAGLIFKDTDNPAARSQTDAPMLQHPVNANLDDKVSLLGYDLTASTVQPGETLGLTLYWQTKSKMDEDYTVFVHLLDPTDSGQSILTQIDRQPFDGMHPTSKWTVGQVVKESYEVTVPALAKAGGGQLVVGIYLLATQTRLAVFDGQGASLGDSVLLQPVRIGNLSSQ